MGRPLRRGAGDLYNCAACMLPCIQYTTTCFKSNHAWNRDQLRWGKMMSQSQSSISSFLPSPAAILCHQYCDQYLARKWWLQLWVYSSYYPSGHGQGCGEAASDIGEFRKGPDLL
jgi:hypothetical protein